MKQWQTPVDWIFHWNLQSLARAKNWPCLRRLRIEKDGPKVRTDVSLTSSSSLAFDRHLICWYRWSIDGFIGNWQRACRWHAGCADGTLDVPMALRRARTARWMPVPRYAPYLITQTPTTVQHAVYPKTLRQPGPDRRPDGSLHPDVPRQHGDCPYQHCGHRDTGCCCLSRLLRPLRFEIGLAQLGLTRLQ